MNVERSDDDDEAKNKTSFPEFETVMRWMTWTSRSRSTRDPTRGTFQKVSTIDSHLFYSDQLNNTVLQYCTAVTAVG